MTSMTNNTTEYSAMLERMTMATSSSNQNDATTTTTTTSPQSQPVTNTTSNRPSTDFVLTKSHVHACSLPTWYPILRKATIRSIVIPLPSTFIEYLNQDGIQLPDLPSNIEIHPNDPRRESTTDWSSDEDDANEDDDNDDDKDTKTEEEIAPTIYCFPELEILITNAIEKLGGDVFPKLNWSSPRDASFIAGGTLKCDNVGSIFLLLKGSDFISHDLNHAFDHCSDKDTLVEELNSDEKKKEKKQENESQSASMLQPQLVLRRWCNLYPSREFRCIVRNNVLVGISQRHCDRCFKNLEKDIDMLTNAIHEFHQNILIPKLTASSLLSNNLGTCYIYDVYINRRTEVTFLDFGVNHALSTDSKMFTWHEIHTWNNSTQVEDGDDIGIDVRFVESMKEAVPSQLSQHRVPADFVGDPNKFLEEFVDAQRRGDFD